MDLQSTFQKWMAQVAANDPTATRELFEKYAARLLRLASAKANAKMRRKEDPADVVQSALGTFFKHLAAGDYKIPDEDYLTRWLVVITINKAAEHARRLGSLKRDVTKEESGPFASDNSSVEWRFVDRKPGPEEEAILREHAAIFLEAVEELKEKLNDREREVFDRWLSGQSAQEIHQETQIPLTTVYHMMERIIKKLSEALVSSGVAVK